jgi:hypothetical protein
MLIIQFLPIYLAEFARAWLDHLQRNAINCWDDLWGGHYWQFLGHLRSPWQPLGPKGLPAEAGRAPPGLHLVFLTKMS